MSSTPEDSDIEGLVQRARGGDAAARDELLGRYRDRLRKMVALRLDRRLAPRVDPSDVVQETLAESFQKLSEYLHTQPIPLYPWLRQIAWEKIVQLHRRHLHSQARALAREERLDMVLPGHSAIQLASQLVADGTSPSRRFGKAELQDRVRAALSCLDSRDREVLILRYLEQLSAKETAEVLGISVAAAKSRQRRALERFGDLVDERSSGSRP